VSETVSEAEIVRDRIERLNRRITQLEDEITELQLTVRSTFENLTGKLCTMTKSVGILMDSLDERSQHMQFVTEQLKLRN
jgi:flagellar capping protein FliD